MKFKMDLQAMAKEELKWQNIDADDLAAAKKSFDAMVEAEAAFKVDLEKLLKAEGHMPEDKFLVTALKEVPHERIRRAAFLGLLQGKNFGEMLVRVAT
jgi:NADPH-dependent curcumin reductase CurA